MKSLCHEWVISFLHSIRKRYPKLQRTIKGYIIVKYESIFVEWNLLLTFLCNKDLYIYTCLCLTMTGILQAFRRLYEHVGLGWVYAITKYEPVSLPFIVLKDLLSCSSSMYKSLHHCLLKNKIAYIFIYHVINGEKNICRLLKLLILYMVYGLSTDFKLQVK